MAHSLPPKFARKDGSLTPRRSRERSAVRPRAPPPTSRGTHFRVSRSCLAMDLARQTFHAAFLDAALAARPVLFSGHVVQHRWARIACQDRAEHDEGRGARERPDYGLEPHDRAFAPLFVRLIRIIRLIRLIPRLILFQRVLHLRTPDLPKQRAVSPRPTARCRAVANVQFGSHVTPYPGRQFFIFIFKAITYLGAYLRPKSASRAGRS